jgi:hypothetical protein
LEKLARAAAFEKVWLLTIVSFHILMRGRFSFTTMAPPVCLGRAKGLVLSDSMEDRAYRQIDAGGLHHQYAPPQLQPTNYQSCALKRP